MFNSKEWENQGQGKRLRGHCIVVRQYNRGKDASFLLEAHSDPWNPETRGHNICRTIQGKGPTAKAEAIRQAKELAATGLYSY